MIYLNGAWLPIEEAKVSVLDRGFIFGDGVYEYVPVVNGRPYRLEGHLARLERSCRAIGLKNPYSDERWRELIHEIVRRNGPHDQGVYWQVTRGVAKRDHAFPKDVEPTVFMMSMPLPVPTPEQIERGVACVTLADQRWQRCDIKSISLLGNVLARQFAVERGAVEAVMLRDGYLSEASASNVFCVIDGTLVSPPKNHLMLGGITLDAVWALAERHGLPRAMRPVQEAELRGADEIWLTSSSKGVLAVTQLDGEPVGHRSHRGRPGPLFQRMCAWLKADMYGETAFDAST
ncbi:MAG: D-amino acid aminotransferase [Casimicrobiaceae bacterium]|nr:D-amino acid aminotransferase [Casimicrobiaceae bacterium]